MIFRKTMLALMVMALLLSGCGGGGDGGGPKEAVVTVVVSPDPVIGESFTYENGGRGIKWSYTHTFTESNGVGVTLTTLDWEVKGDNGYSFNATGQSMNPVSVPANGSKSKNRFYRSGSTDSGEPRLSTGTLKDTFYGTDDNGNSIECSVTVTLR
jgi:hypothetical protein